ncbi:transcriptional regulator, HxlR family [Mesorhizobium albiziae]|uniref:Transcriptional regulator, HxlR family n=1 Tax=Neomesorhizobium albiziae TaxID=335020 RepID=A0A1I4D8X8_9HYPH|nr:helix-turn-helix domain-containing protein [Mesorhizobium albiziae]GLS33612.1 transcriptional regulator [Mesorhizobium albiziae]SFK89270.1 transcriptional regulator, HxlR family [Mesorhizobium albiziae]
MVTIRNENARTRSQDFVLRENCPQRRIHYILSGKWTSMVLYALSHGTMRTGQLERTLPGVSKKMLTQTLREVEASGLVKRKVFDVVPPKVEYSLTALGETFIEPLRALYTWAENNAAALDELDRNQAQNQR